MATIVHAALPIVAGVVAVMIVILTRWVDRPKARHLLPVAARSTGCRLARPCIPPADTAYGLGGTTSFVLLLRTGADERSCCADRRDGAERLRATQRSAA